jgi:hypothetical protein
MKVSCVQLHKKAVMTGNRTYCMWRHHHHHISPGTQTVVEQHAVQDYDKNVSVISKCFKSLQFKNTLILHQYVTSFLKPKHITLMTMDLVTWTKLKMDHEKTLLIGQLENPYKDVTNIQCQTNSGKA